MPQQHEFFKGRFILTNLIHCVNNNKIIIWAGLGEHSRCSKPMNPEIFNGHIRVRGDSFSRNQFLAAYHEGQCWYLYCLLFMPTIYSITLTKYIFMQMTSNYNPTQYVTTCLYNKIYCATMIFLLKKASKIL